MSNTDNTIKDGSSEDDIFFSFKSLRDSKPESNVQDKEKKAEEEVINIYHQNMPRKLEVKPGHGLKIFLIGLVILAISAGLFYYFGRRFFIDGQIFSGDNVELEIEGQTEAASGEELVYKIKYKNLEKIDLADVILNVNYPTGFVYKKAKPIPYGQNNNSWDLGYLRSNAGGQLEIVGSLIGEDGQTQKLAAKLNYHLSGEKSAGEKEAKIETKISSSVLSLDISGPSQLLGQDIEYVVKYSNKTKTPIEDIKIKAIYPESFVFISSEPAPQESGVWLVNQLDGEDSRELKIKGRFEKKDGEVSENDVSKVFKAQIGIVDAQDVFYLQQEKEFNVSISPGDLAISLELNGFTDNAVVSLDDSLNYTVKYINQSELDLEDVKLKLIINSNILDWSSLQNESQAVIADEEIINGMLCRSISWEVKKIEPTEEGSFIVKARTKPYSKLDKTNSLDLRAEGRLQTTIGKIGGEKADKIIETNKLIAQVNSDLKFSSQADLQNEGEYQILWQLTNSIHEVEQVKVSADLGQDLSWLADSAVSAGDIYYDPQSKKISWQINRIPIGLDIPLTAKFKLKTATLGRPILLTNLILSGVDKITGRQISQSFVDVIGE